MLGRAVFGGILILVGLAGAVRPYEVARLGEMLDAIGRRSSGPVEPAGWNVTLTRVIGIGAVLAGVWFVVVGLGTM